MKKAREGSAQHKLIVAEAQRRGYSVSQTEDAEIGTTAILSDGIKTEKLVQGIPSSWVNERSQEVCDLKQKTKQLFDRLNIQTPRSILFKTAEELDSSLFKGDKEFVCKPEFSTNGIGVQLGIKLREDVVNYLARNPHLKPDFMLEEYVKGDDLRIQVIGGKIVAACIRKPAFVVGNGIATLLELIEQKQEIIHAQNPANTIEIDANTLALLEEQNIGLHDVIKAGRDIQLKRIANMGQGATAIDCTDSIHPDLQYWVDKISLDLQAPYFALDIITTDPMNISKCLALELNLRAEWMHHTFSEVRTHDLAKTVINELFKTN